jgi:hypothetical protein
MVLAMPGCIPFVGLSRDERIRGVMKEVGLYDDYYVDYSTPDLVSVLQQKIRAIMGSAKENNRIRKVIEEHLPYYYAQMGLLGLDIRDLVRAEFPGITIKELDEDDVLELVPYVPPQYHKTTQKKFLELKKAEGRSV